MRVINGEGLLLGRLCSHVAKAALMGEEIQIVNCDKIVISGDKKKVLANEKAKRDRKGYPLKSAKFSNLTDRFVRRAVRGMLPHKRPRGREAFARVMCHSGVPAEFAEKMETIENISIKKLPTLKYITVSQICKWFKGGKE